MVMLRSASLLTHVGTPAGHFLAVLLHNICTMDNFEAFYQKKLNDNVLVDPATGCLVWQGIGAGGYGQIRVRLPNENISKQIYVHRLQYMLTSGNFQLNKHIHVSHLCHNTKCIAPEHLSYEPLHINANRQSCRLLVPPRCYTHWEYPDCIFN